MLSGAYREYHILKILGQGLPRGFDVFHSVNWSSLHHGNQTFGELDAVVLGPSGHMMLLEVKAGDVNFSGNAAVKVYNNHGKEYVKDVGHQTRRQHGAMLGRLTDEGFYGVHVSQLLVLPDHTVASGTISFPRERIADATQMNELCQLICDALNRPHIQAAVRERLMDFLANRFDLTPNVSNQVGQVSSVNIRLSEGMATWVPRVMHSSGLYVIEATGGSGKTQLAVSLLRAAARDKQRAAYICYNRPLADRITSLAPHAVEVFSFHEYCVAFSRGRSTEPDFTSITWFDDVVSGLLSHQDEQTGRFDLLIVDESQDFQPEWVQALLPLLKEGGRLYVMGDPDQQLYEREAFTLSDAVQIQCRDNFRSPQKVVQAINQHKLSTQPVLARSVLEGTAPGFHTYQRKKNESKLVLEQCLRQLVQDGFTPDQIAVVTFAGRERAEALKAEKLADMPLKCFTGNFDAAGNPQWSEGTLLVETLYRFKGQSAPVVVLCEVDFETLTDKERRKLFVGFTRAEFRLECVISERAAEALMQSM
jgi:thymidine kinase